MQLLGPAGRVQFVWLGQRDGQPVRRLDAAALPLPHSAQAPSALSTTAEPAALYPFSAAAISSAAVP